MSIEKYQPSEEDKKAQEMISDEQNSKSEAEEVDFMEPLAEHDAFPDMETEGSVWEEKQELLALLPVQLQERWEEKSLEDIQNVVEKRERMGYQKIVGYHVSDKDIPEESVLIPEHDVVEYSDNIEHLYGRHGGGFLYIIEGGANDTITDDLLGWRSKKVKKGEGLKIIDKIKITQETMHALGARFAHMEYH